MTGQQILSADVLDILFEHRNKTYGAYHLRRTYNQRLSFSLLFTLAFVFLLVLLWPSKGVENILPPMVSDEGMIVRTIENTPPPKTLPTPPPQAIAAPRVAQIQHTNIVITPDAQAQTLVPMQDVIASGVISNVTTPGTVYDGTIPPVENGTGNNVSALGTEPEKVVAPSYSAPQFPGGAEAWMRFLNRHLRAPDALQAGEKKSVLIRFLVSADGSIAQYEVVQSGGNAFDDEVIRVLKKMPKWKPALQNGKPVTVTFTQPVTFVSPEE